MLCTPELLQKGRSVRLLHGEYEESMNVFILESNTLRCLSSSPPLIAPGDVRLLFGDRLEVEKVDDDTYRFVSVVPEQEYVHYFYNLGVWGGPAGLISSKKTERDLARKGLHDFLREHFTLQPFTDYLHAICGEWERDDFLGATLMVHLPREHVDEYHHRLPELSPGLAKEKWAAISSGVVDSDEDW